MCCRVQCGMTRMLIRGGGRGGDPTIVKWKLQPPSTIIALRSRHVLGTWLFTRGSNLDLPRNKHQLSPKRPPWLASQERSGWLDEGAQHPCPGLGSLAEHYICKTAVIFINIFCLEKKSQWWKKKSAYGVPVATLWHKQGAVRETGLGRAGGRCSRAALLSWEQGVCFSNTNALLFTSGFLGPI